MQREEKIRTGEYIPQKKKKSNLKKKRDILVSFEELKAKVSITILSAIVSVLIIPYVKIFDVTVYVRQTDTSIEIGTMVDYIFIVLIFYLLFTVLINLNKRKKLKRWDT